MYGYEVTARMIGYVVKKMQQAGIVSSNVKITGRVKSYKSVIGNEQKKAIDDCFGIRIVASENELEKIKNELEKVLIIDCTKDHRRKKSTNYKGVHQMAHIKREFTEGRNVDYDLFPEIEIQYWSKEIAKDCIYGWLSYANYKKDDFNKIIEELKFDRQGVLRQLPKYIEINGGEILEYLPEETLYKLYPEIRRMEIKGKFGEKEEDR